MIRVHIICEGTTEETFIKEVLAHDFAKKGIVLIPSLIGKKGHKGGNIKFQRLSLDIRNRLNDKQSYCSTFFDFYALPKDFPGIKDAANQSSIESKSKCVQDAMAQEIRDTLSAESGRRFIPYVQMYEFEALLFSDPEKFCSEIGHKTLSPRFKHIRTQFRSPEEINDSPATAPSKRIEKFIPNYEKPISGTIAALGIGLPKIRSECRLFDAWLQRLEALKPLS